MEECRLQEKLEFTTSNIIITGSYWSGTMDNECLTSVTTVEYDLLDSLIQIPFFGRGVLYIATLKRPNEIELVMTTGDHDVRKHIYLKE